MPFPDPARILRASKLRFGPVQARGVPAILFGVAGLITAVGFARALGAGTLSIPDTIRELRSGESRGEPRKLNA